MNMAFSLLKVKNIFNQKKGRLSGSGSLEPEIGFKVVHNQSTNCLYVTVIGARHLPSLFGLSTAKGYVVKVKLFPGVAKFESQLQDTSWPVWNEEFKFQLNVKKTKKGTENRYPTSQLQGYFISLTIYAILDTAPPKEEKKKKTTTLSSDTQQNATAKTNDNENTSALAKFEKVVTSTFKSSTKETQQSTRGGSVDKRRTIGNATWNFDTKMFTNDLKHDQVGTPDIWRPIEQISSGVTPAAASGHQESKKGQVEITLLYTRSEDGCNDTIQINVNKMRCSVQIMQEHELKKEPLYIKSSISNRDSEVHWKSERFFPTISARWDSKTSCARLRFNSKTIQDTSIYVSLGCKNSMGIKEILGKVTVAEKTQYADFWRSVIDSPGIPKTQWLSFE